MMFPTFKAWDREEGWSVNYLATSPVRADVFRFTVFNLLLAVA
jgi:hypothetical protein